MAINYPNAPTIGETHIVGNITWTWDGTAWSIQSTSGGSGGGGGSYSNTDVDTHLQTSTASSGEVLSWDGAGYDWVAQSGGGGGASAINDLSDVNVSNPQDNEVLKYSSGEWVNGTDATGAAGTVAFTDLTD